MMDWLELSCNQNLHQHSPARLCDFPETKQDDGAAKCTLALFSDRVIADKAEVIDLLLLPSRLSLISNTTKTNLFLAHNMYRVTALFQNADRGSRRQQTVLEKVKVLLSSAHQTCLFDLFGGTDSGKKHQNLDLNDLPVEKLIQSISKMSPARRLLMIYKERLESQEGKSIKQPMHCVSSCMA